MSKVGNYGLIILTLPLKTEFISKYQKNIVTLYILHVHLTKERGKNPVGKSSLKHEHEKPNFGNLVINHAS